MHHLNRPAGEPESGNTATSSIPANASARLEETDPDVDVTANGYTEHREIELACLHGWVARPGGTPKGVRSGKEPRRCTEASLARASHANHPSGHWQAIRNWYDW